MTVSLFFQLLINGIALGLLYMMVVLGLDVILRVTGLINFAHGQIFMLGAYTLFFSVSMLHVNFALGLLFSGIAISIAGCVCYVLVFYQLQKRFAPGDLFVYMMSMSAMASLGLMMVISQGALVVFGADQKTVTSPFPQVLSVSGVTFPAERLMVIGVSVVILVLLYFLMYRTRLGRAMRAVSLDAEVSSMHGINAFKVYLMGFGLGCGLAGLAGGTIAPLFPLSTDMGVSMIILALLVQLMGGVGSYKGTIYSAIIVGLVLSFGQFFVGGLAQVLLFGFVIVLLIFRPQGLFGEGVE